MFDDKRQGSRKKSYGGDERSERSTHEATLFRREIQIERKVFSMVLKENARGRFLRIVENSGNVFASIIVPICGLVDFHKLIEEMTQADAEIPFKNQTAP